MDLIVIFHKSPCYCFPNGDSIHNFPRNDVFPKTINKASINMTFTERLTSYSYDDLDIAPESGSQCQCQPERLESAECRVETERESGRQSQSGANTETEQV